MNVAVAGMGYVGLSIATMLSRSHHVSVVDVIAEKVEMLAAGVSPIKDETISRWLAQGGLDLNPTLDGASAYAQAQAVIVAVPTDYDVSTGAFDTSLVDSVIDMALAANPQVTVVVKSTIPMGYTDAARAARPGARILFSPEFLREGHALDDCLAPSRVIVGIPACDLGDEATVGAAEGFVRLMVDCSDTPDAPTIVMPAAEAESVKLFSNTYLAMRVAFFNELDTFAACHGLDTASIVKGVALDPRIGDHYNNPSFGYGGYCLPKDTKELLSLARDVPQDLLGAIVDSNQTRIEFVAHQIARQAQEAAPRADDDVSGEKRRPVVGIFRLAMKAGSDNHRASSTLGVMEALAGLGVDMVLYDPSVGECELCGAKVIASLGEFKRASDVIVANRVTPEVADVREKLFTRDLYGRD